MLLMSPLKGILFMCAGVMILPFLNATAKLLLEHYPLVQVMWARYTMHLLLVLLVLWPKHRSGLLVTRKPGLQLLRSTLLLMCTSCYFSALWFIPLATAAAISFTAPVIITFLAIPLLKEKVGWRRILAVLVGLSGALVIIRPGFGGFHPAGFLMLAGAAVFALYQIYTRKVLDSDTPETSIAYMTIVGAVGTSVLLPWFWTTPATLSHWWMFLATGVFAGGGHFMVVKAVQYAPVSVVSPFIYVELIGATILGYMWFDHVPEIWAWVGSAMIICSGLFIAYREQWVHKKAPP